jgi:hypothetical protein
MSFEKRLDEFSFPSPDEWYCQVVQFYRGHSELQIKAQHMATGEVLTIVFVATIYFEGPLMWYGADFMLEPQEKCEILMQKLGETDLKIVLEARRLFHIGSNTSRLAASYELLDIKQIPRSLLRGVSFSGRISKALDSNTRVRIVAGESAFVTDKKFSILPY